MYVWVLCDAGIGLLDYGAPIRYIRCECLLDTSVTWIVSSFTPTATTLQPALRMFYYFLFHFALLLRFSLSVYVLLCVLRAMFRSHLIGLPKYS